MENLLLFLLVILVSLLQSTVLPLNLLLLFVLVKDRLLWAFIGGLVLDLLSGQRLGLSSILFLLILYLFRLYSRKYEPRAFFLMSFVFLTSFLFAKVHDQVWSFWQGLILGLFLLPLREGLQRGRQLKLNL